MLLIEEPDLITTINVLDGKGLTTTVGADRLLGNVIQFVQVMEYLQPLVGNIKPVVAYMVLEQLGLTGFGNALGETPAGGMAGGVPSLPS